MTNPCPGYGISTPYGRRGPYWSCDEDSAGNGIHTGVDYAAPAGAKCVAARPGQVVHSSHGSAFGSHQVDVIAGDGTRDFYAHMRSRVAHGTRVDAGDKIGEVGSEGNVTGAHLHFERHATETGGWSCSVVRDPAPSINYQPAAGSGGSGAGTEPEGEPMPNYVRVSRVADLKLKADAWTSIEWDDVLADEGDAVTDGEAGIRIGGSAFMATLALTVDGAEGEAIRTRWLERDTVNGQHVTEETYATLEHRITAGATYLTDARVQRVGNGRRLVAQVHSPSAATLTAGSLNLLYFPAT